MTQHLEELLETLVRPALREHGGDVELVRYENGVLRLKMLGRCAGCPGATLTNETLIEGQLKPLLPELREVILVHAVSDSLLAHARDMMTRIQLQSYTAYHKNSPGNDRLTTWVARRGFYGDLFLWVC